MADANSIQLLVNSFAGRGQMLMLSKNEIYEKIFEFMVYEKDGEVAGVCALHPMWEDLAEIRSLAVSEKIHKCGIGGSLVSAQLERAKEFGLCKVFTLTYMENFFSKQGFNIISKEELPKKIWTDCLKCVKFPDCDEIAMIKEL
jgi:amino-acid N-acetyltransferase